MSELEDRLRQAMRAAVDDVDLPPWMPGEVVRVGRRRARRRRALMAAPLVVTAAAVGGLAVGGLVVSDVPVLSGGDDGRGAAGGEGGAVVTASPAPHQASPTPSPSASRDPVLDEAARVAQRAARAKAAAEEVIRQRDWQMNQEAAHQLAAEGKAELSAYYGAGYSYEEAQQLAAVWHVGTDEAKATAGAKLLAGQSVPVAPDYGLPRVVDDDLGLEVDAFAGMGYTSDDAFALGALWNLDGWDAKVQAGQDLLAGDVLPAEPSGEPVTADPASPWYDLSRASLLR